MFIILNSNLFFLRAAKLFMKIFFETKENFNNAVFGISSF